MTPILICQNAATDILVPVLGHPVFGCDDDGLVCNVRWTLLDGTLELTTDLRTRPFGYPMGLTLRWHRDPAIQPEEWNLYGEVPTEERAPAMMRGFLLAGLRSHRLTAVVETLQAIEATKLTQDPTAP